VLAAALLFAEDDTALLKRQRRANTYSSYIDVLEDLLPPLRSVRVDPARHAAGRVHVLCR
jgi:hypothetical protein